MTASQARQNLRGSSSSVVIDEGKVIRVVSNDFVIVNENFKKFRAMEKIEIDKNKPLNPGDIIELHFRSPGMVWIAAAQIALIEWRLEKRKDFRMLSHSLPAGNRVIFTIKILKTNPVVLTAAVIGAAIIGAGVVAWLTLDKVYQIVESPVGKVAVGGTALFLPALAIIAIIFLLRK